MILKGCLESIKWVIFILGNTGWLTPGDRYLNTRNFFFETYSNREKQTPGCLMHTEADYIFEQDLSKIYAEMGMQRWVLEINMANIWHRIEV